MVGSLSGGFMQLPMTREKKKQENLLARTGLDPFSRSSRSEGGLWPRATTLKTRTQISRTGLRLENNFTISRELHVEEKIYMYICIHTLYIYIHIHIQEKGKRTGKGEEEEEKKEEEKWRDSTRVSSQRATMPGWDVYTRGGLQRRGKKGVKWKKKIGERGEKWRKGIKKETSESSDKNNRSKPACSSKGLTPSTRRLFHVQFTSSSKSLCVTRSGENRFSTWINGNKYFRFFEWDEVFACKIFFDMEELCNNLCIISKRVKLKYEETVLFDSGRGYSQIWFKVLNNEEEMKNKTLGICLGFSLSPCSFALELKLFLKNEILPSESCA